MVFLPHFFTIFGGWASNHSDFSVGRLVKASSRDLAQPSILGFRAWPPASFGGSGQKEIQAQSFLSWSRYNRGFLLGKNTDYSGDMALGLTAGHPLIPRAYRGRPHSDFEFPTIPPFNFVYFS